ncbi:MAG: hypothetical protein K6A82_04140 [Prevotella sp.]|nr:hypothetical protein [Prevotella sp.]
MTETEETRLLLDRFYNGLTTEEEEDTLRSYFKGGNVDAALEKDRIFFTALQPADCPVPEGLESRLERQVSQWNTIETATRRNARHAGLRWVVGIAASLLLLTTIGTIAYHRQDTSKMSQEDTYTNTQDAYAETSRALIKFSKTLNRGIEAAERITNKERD